MKGKKVKKQFVSSKRGIVVKGEWKAVNVDPTLFSDEGLEGLVCFEELTDYSLVEPEKTINAEKFEKKTRKDRKRKSSEIEEHLKSDDTEDKSDKKKKKQTRKIYQDVMVEQDVDDDFSLEDCPEEQTPQTSFTVSKKKDSKKQQKKKKNRKKHQKKKKLASEVKESHAQTEVGTVIIQPKTKTRNWTNVALADTEDQNADVSAWKELFVPAAVLKALSKLGFSAPTPIQALAIPPAIRDHLDVLGAAETGSGKTLCFGIPMIHTILKWRKESNHEPPQKSEVHAESVKLPADSETDTLRAREEEEEEEEEEDDADADADGGESSKCCTGNAEASAETAGNDSAADDKAHKTADMTGAERNTQKRPLLCLVLTPTRELAVQVKHHMDAVAQFTGIKTAIVVGGMAPQKQQRMLMRRPEIVIATPGRLWEMIKERHPHLLNLRQLRCLVIDEADRMVEKGHFSELDNLLELLNTSQFNSRRQTFVFSATLTMVHSLPLRLQQRKGRNMEQRSKLQLLIEKVGIKDKPKIINLTRKEATVETLTETRINCAKEEKDFYLYYFLLQYRGRTMVFANSIDCIKRLSALLQILDCSPLPLHANMHQKQRLKNLEKFAENESCVLLTTDVAARGLDIPNVQHVIHYQVPRTSETYVHRSGRTARATKEGLSLLLIGPDDVINFRKICRTLEKDEDLPVFPVHSSCMAAIQERVNLSWKIEKMEYFHSREKQHNSWFRQAAEAMDIDVDEDLLLGAGKGEDEDRQQQKVVKLMKKQLKRLISQPVFRNQMKTKYPTQMGKLHLPQTPISTVALTCVKHTR